MVLFGNRSQRINAQLLSLYQICAQTKGRISRMDKDKLIEIITQIKIDLSTNYTRIRGCKLITLQYRKNFILSQRSPFRF